VGPARSEQSDMRSVPIAVLELRALEQRAQIHKTAAALRAKILRTRDQMNIPKQARNHRVAASIIVAGVGIVSGYGLTGLFTRY